MNIKEAYKIATTIVGYTPDEIEEAKSILLKSLDKLDKLEKENQELKKGYKKLQVDYNDLQKNYDMQEEDYDKIFAQFLEIGKENIKFEQAVGILKEKLEPKLEVHHNGGCTLNYKVIRDCITPDERCLRYLKVKEYEVLQEAFENVDINIVMDRLEEKRIYGHTVSYWRVLYENEFGRDTSKESNYEFLKKHKTWIMNNSDESRHC